LAIMLFTLFGGCRVWRNNAEKILCRKDFNAVKLNGEIDGTRIMSNYCRMNNAVITKKGIMS
jgi:hypothetical protein